jgi:hypothetical protein
MPGDSGPEAKDALLRQLGEHEILIDELVNMLVKKGIMTDEEWEAIQVARFLKDERRISAFGCPDKDDRAALDAFFG